MATKHTFDVYTEESVFCIIFVPASTQVLKQKYSM